MGAGFGSDLSDEFLIAAGEKDFIAGLLGRLNNRGTDALATTRNQKTSACHFVPPSLMNGDLTASSLLSSTAPTPPSKESPGTF
jgi:hypothetical protein